MCLCFSSAVKFSALKMTNYCCHFNEERGQKDITNSKSEGPISIHEFSFLYPETDIYTWHYKHFHFTKLFYLYEIAIIYCYIYVFKQSILSVLGYFLCGLLVSFHVYFTIKQNYFINGLCVTAYLPDINQTNGLHLRYIYCLEQWNCQPHPGDGVKKMILLAAVKNHPCSLGFIACPSSQVCLCL